MSVLFIVLSALVLAPPRALASPQTGGIIDPYIVGGDTALRGQFPYQVSVRRVAWFTWRHQCGGTLITADWVLTTASCTQGAWFLRVVGGKTDLRSTEDGEQVAKVSKTVVHPDFKDKSPSWQWDLALLQTATPLQYSDVVRPARLPLAGTTGGAFLVTGWGVTSPGGWFGWGRRAADKLQVTLVQTVPCSEQDGETAVNNLCVLQGSAATPCEGDEGGAMVQMLSDNTFTIVAMVTRTPRDCKNPRQPSAAVSVFGQSKFIKDTITS